MTFPFKVMDGVGPQGLELSPRRLLLKWVVAKVGRLSLAIIPALWPDVMQLLDGGKLAHSAVQRTCNKLNLSREKLRTKV